MQYVKVENYNKDNLKFTLALILAVVWFLTSFLFVSKVNIFPSFSFARPSNSAVIYAPNVPKVVIGPETEKLIESIKVLGLNPIVVGSVTRSTFSAEGKIVTLNNDNIKIFEYKDVGVASAEVEAFRKSAETPYGAWKKDVHLYASENLIVFYMGERKSIINSLDSIFGQAVAV